MSRTALSCLLSATLFAQLTPNQKQQDILELAAAYNKFYAPANWKIQALNANIFDIGPFIAKARATPTDAEYYAVMMEYVASLRDGHSSVEMPSDFRATLGVGVDIYDGKVLIESISNRYPPTAFAFRVGDELVSIDGVPVGATLDRLSKLQSLGNERPTRRLAAAFLTSRPQAVDPLAYLLPDQSTVVIRRAATDALESYVLTWLKTGEPIVNLSRRPDLGWPILPTSVESAGSPIERLLERSARVAKPHVPRRTRGEEESGEPVSSRALVGLGSRTPYYALPADFVRRRGTGSDFFFTGTYMSGGLRIGLIRLPNFLAQFGAQRRAMLRELEAEVTFMEQNTDGVVFDVSRSAGGFCSGDVASRLTRGATQVYRDLLLPTTLDVLLYNEIVAEAEVLAREPWVVDLWRFNRDALRDAANGLRSLTGPLAGCLSDEFSSYPVGLDSYPPWRGADGSPAGYSKPLIVLQDELSASQAEHFSAIMQDNNRGPIVGIRSPGLGGATSGIGGPYYSEASASMTFSLTIRGKSPQVPGLPSAPVIETLGVLPDSVLDSMTRENLMNRFRPFFAQVTQAMVDHIRAPRTQ